MAIGILSDSTCDLSKELIDRYDIHILPLHILLGDDEYSDGVNINPDQIYEWAEAHKTVPKTSAPSLSDAKEALDSMLNSYDEIVCFSIASGMSSSGNVMRMAAEELEAEDRVSVVDSANLSTGIALLILRAADLISAGAAREAVLKEMEALKDSVRASFVVDTLVYLHRGGRCSGLAAMAGGMLRLHPKIVVEHGAMRPDKKYRGRLSSVILDYARDMEADLKTADPDRVFITHSGCSAEVIEKVRQYLQSLGQFKEILETRAGGVISSHCGPGTLGVLYIARSLADPLTD